MRAIQTENIMATELYDILVPPLVRGLTALAAVLDKGATYAKEQGIAEEDLLGTRLVADMLPLTAQVQRVSDSAKGAVQRLGGGAAVAMPDEETTFAALQDRIARTLAVVNGTDRASIDGKEDAEIVLTFPNGEYRMTGRAFVGTFVLPNFYFHVTMAYALLRMRGVPVGKIDYLGGI